MATEAPAAAPTGTAWEDPYRAFEFSIEIDGVTEGHFVECSGLGMKINVVDYREGGGNNQITHRLPGAVEYASVTLRGGMTSSTVLFDWMQSIAHGAVDRRNMAVIMLKPDGTQALRWNLQRAWPSEWYCAPLDAGGNELAIQTITIVFDSLERAQ